MFGKAFSQVYVPQWNGSWEESVLMEFIFINVKKIGIMTSQMGELCIASL